MENATIKPVRYVEGQIAELLFGWTDIHASWASDNGPDKEGKKPGNVFGRPPGWSHSGESVPHYLTRVEHCLMLLKRLL
jgi:hypothetical protein